MAAQSPFEQATLGRIQNFLSRKQLDQAEEALQQVLKYNPQNLQALIYSALVDKEKCSYQSALAFIDRAIALSPARIAAMLRIRADILESDDQDEEALECLLETLSAEPDSVSTLNTLGMINGKLHRYAQASEFLLKAIKLEPDSAESHTNLALILMWAGELEKSAVHFRKGADLHVGQSPLPTKETEILLSWLFHESDQIKYLSEKNLLPSEHSAYARRLDSIVGQYSEFREQGGNSAIRLSADDISAISPSFNRFVYTAEGPLLDDGTVNGALDIDAIEDEYLSRIPGLVVIDDILTPEALDSLYQYCVKSTIFKKRVHKSGYVGSILDEGFASPLLLQIGEEFRQTFPRIFRNHLLHQSWAYKYDSRLSGINVHADFAAVNVNFWISPDEGNLDKGSGGLVLWDKVAPRDWTFDDYNNSQQKIYDFLASSNAKSIRVPFKRNRALFFDSTVFHRTDDISFRDRYEDRRINVTFLYGSGFEKSAFTAPEAGSD